MAFSLAYFGRVDVGLNNTFTINYTNGAGTSEGNEGLFQYNGKTAGDAIATVIAANYFLPVVNLLQVGSVIFISATDGDGMYVVSTLTYPDEDGAGAAVAIVSYGANGSVGTANIQSHAVTYPKIQQASAATLLGNPTGGLHDVEEITLGNGLDFTGTVLEASKTNGVYLTGTINAASFQGMYAAPVLLVAAPGTHVALVVEEFVLETIYGTTQYTAGGAVGVQYDSTLHAGGAPASATIAAATINGYAANAVVGVQGSLASAAASAVVNKGLYLANATQAFATGDSTFVYHLWYSVVPTTV